MSMLLKDYHRQFQLIKRRQAEIHVQQSEPSRKFMTIFAFFMRVLGNRFVRFMERKFHLRPFEQMVDRLMQVTGSNAHSSFSADCFRTKRNTCETN